jgi:ribosomal protein S18 acetylase RimI-like enzyme
MESDSIYYRLARSEDYPSIAEIHLLAFNDFFLSSLGKSFLRTYYKASLKNEECVAVCAISEDNKIIGFAIGTRLSQGYHKRLLVKNFFPFLLRSLEIIIKNPGAIIRLSRNLKKTANSMDDGLYAELLSIGVLESVKGKGVGWRLINLFEQELVSRGCKMVALTTDYYKNDDVINFYKKQGYGIYSDFVTYPDRKMYKLIKTL